MQKASRAVNRVPECFTRLSKSAALRLVPLLLLTVFENERTLRYPHARGDARVRGTRSGSPSFGHGEAQPGEASTDGDLLERWR
jgi:hypothetical protein